MTILFQRLSADENLAALFVTARRFALRQTLAAAFFYLAFLVVMAWRPAWLGKPLWPGAPLSIGIVLGIVSLLIPMGCVFAYSRRSQRDFVPALSARIQALKKAK
ncbi:MAG: DUF485 domain-containing protein [Zoogloeaceae bacterium]|jgi:uncharacterized membrane protein (DUF485 family)|nr:DUF485 domain-containing protein [Zoogloeaceae bacterium]